MPELNPANKYLIGGGAGWRKTPPGLTYLLFFLKKICGVSTDQIFQYLSVHNHDADEVIHG